MPKNPTMNFQAYLEDAWRIIKQEPLIIIGGGLLYQLLFLLTQGVITILAGPLLGGYLLLIILYLRENRKPTFSDLFIGFKQFGNLFLFFLVLLIIFIGFALLVLPGLVFATWWLYVLPLMADRKMSFSDAMRMSMNKVNEKGFFMHLVFLLFITLLPILLLNMLTAVMPAFMVLSVLLPPFQAGCLASLYIDQFGQDVPAEPEEAAKEPGAASAEITVPQVAGAAEQEAAVEEDNPAAPETAGDSGGSEAEKQNHSGEDEAGQEKT
jgi:MFS family permease